MIPSFCAYERGMASKISSIGRRRICGTENEFFVLFCIVKRIPHQRNLLILQRKKRGFRNFRIVF